MINKAFLFFLVIIFIFPSLADAAKIASLPDILKPRMIAVDDDTIYITDQESLFVYSLSKFELVKRIGQKGKGPGEYVYTPYVQILKDKILLYDGFKFSLFEKKNNGRLIIEKKFSFPVFKINLAGGSYIRHQFTFDKKVRRFTEITAYDQNFKKIKPLYKKESKIKPLDVVIKEARFVAPIVTFQCWEDRIFLANGHKGFYIEIFDERGQSLTVIKKDYEKIRISEAEKKRLIEDFKNRLNLRIQNRWEYFKRVAGDFDKMFPEYFPAMQSLSVSDDKLYVKTYNRKGENGNWKEEYVILDLKGNIVKKVFLPYAKDDLMSFKNDFFYYLDMKEYEDGEEWELYYEKIE
jgi:hypothetical protein